MVILEAPYVSDLFCSYLAKEKIAVLHNAFADECAKRHNLHLIGAKEFTQNLATGSLAYTNSENALGWLYSHAPQHECAAMLAGIRLMKDKNAFRKALQPLFPDYTYREIAAEALRTVDVCRLNFPLILKPSVGFFSMGVYAITSLADWNAALTDIEAQLPLWQAAYPSSVLGESRFLVESYIKGEEFAVDCYFDGEGRAVILNILQHPFSSSVDVSDRLYLTSNEILETYLEPFTDFLNQANAYIGVRHFPAHVELRVEQGRVMPIEFNPMRFAGWSTTDIAYYAYGINSCEYFFKQKKPNWKKLFCGKDASIYSFTILNKPKASMPLGALNQQAVHAHFSKVFELRTLHTHNCPVFGFVFAQTPTSKQQELESILHSDLNEFLL